MLKEDVMQIPVYEKRGYLNEDFRFFSISGKGLPEMDYHYHEFHKIIFLLNNFLLYLETYVNP